MDIIELYNRITPFIDYHKFINGSNEIIVRCPYCGDSVKHENKGHFYIGESNNGMFLYQCKRAECGVTGVLNKRVLSDLNVQDLDLMIDINKLNVNSTFNKIIETKNNNYNRFNTYDFEHKNNNNEKMDYLRNRLFDIDKIDLNKYRIILSIKNFIETFSLYSHFKNKSLLDNLEKNAIGFLNFNSSAISFRYFNNSKYRYYKVKLNDDIDLYSIRTELDLLYSREITINICEGAFDIINIRNRLFKEVDENENIFIASNSGDYITKIEYLSKLLGLVNFKINVFRDSDVSTEKIKNQFKNSIFYNNLNIYSNSLGKDYSEDKLRIFKDY